MTALSLTYTLSNGPTTDATQVEQDFADIQTYINGSVIRTDGVVGMAAALSLVAGDPTGSAHAVRKDYVDGSYVYANGGIATAYVNTAKQTALFTTKTTDALGEYNLGTGVFTVVRRGIYSVTLGCQPTWNTSLICHATCNAGGAIYAGPIWRPNLQNQAETAGMIAHWDVSVAPGDTILPQINLSASGTLTVMDFLTIAWLHA